MTWKLYWCDCTEDDSAGDYFVIAQSADEARLFHASSGSRYDLLYSPDTCTAKFVAYIPSEIATPFRRFQILELDDGDQVTRPRIFGRQPFYPWKREFVKLGIQEAPAYWTHEGRRYPRRAFRYKGKWFVPRGAFLSVPKD